MGGIELMPRRFVVPKFLSDSRLCVVVHAPTGTADCRVRGDEG